MKKRLLALTLIAALAFAMSACKKEEDTTSNIVDKENVTSTADDVKKELDNFAKDADKNADLKKLDGKTLKGEGDSYKGDLDGYEVEIGDAVLVDGEDSKVLVVEFDFKNNKSQTTKFSSVMDVDAIQNSSALAPAVTFSAEGYEVLTVAQDVKNGDSIKVQKAYVVTDTAEPVTIQVAKHQNYGGSDVLSKTFNLQ